MAAVGRGWAGALPAVGVPEAAATLPSSLRALREAHERQMPRLEGMALPARVLHLADRLTPEVMGFLGPASAVLEQAGVAQCLITADSEPAARWVVASGGTQAGGAGHFAGLGAGRGPGAGGDASGLDPSVRPLCLAANVAWRAPAAGQRRLSSWRRWQLATDALAEALRESPPAAVHVHGFVAALAAGVMLRRQWRGRARGEGRGSARHLAPSPASASVAPGRPAIVYYSPHGSASLGRLRWLGIVLQAAARVLIGSQPFDRVITCCTAESRLLPGVPAMPDAPAARPAPRRLAPWQIHLAESPVARCFHEQTRRPAPEPLVMAGVLEEGLPAAERAARLAVLLNDEELRARMRWVGRTPPDSRTLLRAAGIDLTPADDDRALAAAMAAAWVFVAPAATTRFPLLLAQAMAARLPCVALDSPFNAALIKDGHNGFLCRDLEQMLERTRELIQYPALRERIGRAARREAGRRFDEGLFRHAVLLGYAEPDGGPAAPALREVGGGVGTGGGSGVGHGIGNGVVGAANRAATEAAP